jgi:ribosomal protein L11 methyltransferase
MIQVKFSLPVDIDDEYIATLFSEIGYEGFYVEDGVMYAYVEDEKYEKEFLESFFQSHFPEISYEVTRLEDKNWNELWESNFQPVLIENAIYVRAPFHSPQENVPYDIIIMPKMSFGTAHHPTTYGMLQLMMNMDLAEKKVLDVGTGTGILAIFAAKKGASFVCACDIDEWSYQNAQENFALNNLSQILLVKGNIKQIEPSGFDIILANITKNTLLDEIKWYVEKLSSTGTLLLSGFLVDDLVEIDKECSTYHLELKSFLMKDQWIVAKYDKKK